MNSDLCLLNDGSFTRVPDRADHRPTAVDITLVSSSLYDVAEWEVCDDPLGSDHLPIRLTLQGVQLETQPPGEQHYDYNKADWNAFRSRLESAACPEPGDDVEQWHAGLRGVVLQAAHPSIPKKRHRGDFKHPSNPWWNSQCKEDQSAARKAYTQYKRRQDRETYKRMKETRIKFKKTVAESKVNYWLEYVKDNVCDYKDSSKLWKKVSKIKRRYNPPERRSCITAQPPPLPKKRLKSWQKLLLEPARRGHYPHISEMQEVRVIVLENLCHVMMTSP